MRIVLMQHFNNGRGVFSDVVRVFSSLLHYCHISMFHYHCGCCVGLVSSYLSDKLMNHFSPVLGGLS